MGGFSASHWVVVCLAILLLFGRGRLPQMLGDVGEGLKQFRKELTEDTHDDE